MSDYVYLVLCGMGDETEEIIGPFREQKHAEVAAEAILQLPREPSHLWGEKDTWVRVKKRRVIA